MRCINCNHEVVWLVKPMCKPIHIYRRSHKRDGVFYPNGAVSKECLVKGCKCKKPIDETTKSVKEERNKR